MFMKAEIRQVVETVFLRRASIKKAKLTDDLDLEKTFKGNVFLLGHIILDLHETFDLPREYPILSEFDIFKTPGIIVDYLYEKTNQKDIKKNFDKDFSADTDLETLASYENSLKQDDSFVSDLQNAFSEKLTN